LRNGITGIASLIAPGFVDLNISPLTKQHVDQPDDYKASKTPPSRFQKPSPIPVYYGNKPERSQSMALAVLSLRVSLTDVSCSTCSFEPPHARSLRDSIGEETESAVFFNSFAPRFTAARFVARRFVAVAFGNYLRELLLLVGFMVIEAITWTVMRLHSSRLTVYSPSRVSMP
jgi:hypothetical protein